MSNKIPCSECGEEFSPNLKKKGYYGVCPVCTQRQPPEEPEPLVAGIGDESGTFEEILPKSRMVRSAITKLHIPVTDGGYSISRGKRKRL